MRPSKFDAVGLRVRIYLEDDGEWHDGMVEEYHPRRGYHVQLFDGQDLWSEHLDENVEFEQEYDVEDDFGATHGKTVDTQMSFHDDELEFLQDAENVLDGADRAGNDQPDEDYATGLEVPDYNTHQDYNQRAIRADLPTLPARGVLLSGSVLGATGLAIPEEDAAEGEIFFKVLFVEGGSQPAMFRCKTPIFTSSPVPNTLSSPHWRDGRFQFDMIMPVDAAQDAKSPHGFKIQGEIIIAVYLSRSNGGNHFLGQTSFQLKDIVETGTVEYFLAGYEGRSVTGAHTILSRTGDITGEVDVQLNIAWKSLRTALASGTLTASQSKLGLPPRPVSATAGTTSVAGASRTGSRAQTTGRDGSAPRQRPASGTANKGTLPPPRKIVSGLLRKQREDQARIARENKKLQQTLEQHANRNRAGTRVPVATAYAGTAGAGVASTSAGAARPLSATASAATGVKRLSTVADAKDTAEGRDPPRNPTRGASAGSKAGDDSGAVLDGLVRMYNDLKRSTALEDQELTNLRLKVGKLKVSVKQAEMSVNRIRAEGGGGDVHESLSKGSLRGSLRNSGEGNVRGRESPAVSTAPPKDTPPRDSARSQSQAKGEGRHVARVGSHAYVPFFEPLSEAQLKALDVQDGEYKSLAEEYTVLQAVRRGLLDRLATAKAACDSAGEKQLSARDRLEMIRRRVDYYRDIAGKLAIGVVLQLEDGAALGAKRVATVDEDSRHGDYLLFDRLREVKQEYVTEFALYETGMHTIAQDNALEELRAVRDLLAGKCATLDKSVRALKQDNDGVHQQLREALGAQRELDVDAYVQRLRQERSLQRGGAQRRGPALSETAEERLQAASDGFAAVDKQLRGVKERQEERRMSRAAPVAGPEVERMVELDG